MPAQISLCMITRDEEKYIERCLASTGNLFTETIIVDTGSRDRTVKIAESFGAKIVSHQWQDNFSIPRNISLEHATGDWIFILDADEQLCPESKDCFEKVTGEKSGALGYRVSIQLHPDWTEMKGIRLFRNLPELRFRGVFHEMLDIPEAQKNKFPLSDIRILHEPWTENNETMKLPRNERLLEKHLREFPEDIYQILDLARIKIKTEAFTESATLLARASEILEQRVFQKDSYEFYLAHYYLYRMDYYHALKDYQNKLMVCKKAVSEVPGYPLFAFEAAVLCYQMQNYDQALAYFSKCLSFPEDQAHKHNMFIPKAILGAKALAGQGYCYFRKKQFRQAASCFKEALALEDDTRVKSMYRSAVTLGKLSHS